MLYERRPFIGDRTKAKSMANSILTNDQYCMPALVLYYVSMLLTFALTLSYTLTLNRAKKLNLEGLDDCAGTETKDCFDASHPYKIDDKVVTCTGGTELDDALFSLRGQQVYVAFATIFGLLSLVVSVWKFLGPHEDRNEASPGVFVKAKNAGYRFKDKFVKVFEFLFLALFAAAYALVIESRPQDGTDGGEPLGASLAFNKAGCTAGGTAVDDYTKIVGDGFGMLTSAAVFYGLAYLSTRVYNPRLSVDAEDRKSVV